MTSISDLFEDRRFTVGFRLAGSLENSTYAMAYSDLAKRWDKTWSLERQGITQASNGNQSLIKTHIHLLRHRLTYPFDEVRSLRLQGVMRLDRNVPLSIDAYNLRAGTSFTTQWGAEIAYVFDSSRKRSLNIREGTRYPYLGPNIYSLNSIVTTPLGLSVLISGITNLFFATLFLLYGQLETGLWAVKNSFILWAALIMFCP